MNTMKREDIYMKHIFLTLLAAALPCLAHADNDGVGKLEGGISVGSTLPLGGGYGGKIKPGTVLNGEMRYNFANTGWDCGVMLQFNNSLRDFDMADKYFNYQDNSSDIVAVTGDYNFRQGARINPFAGLGIGFAIQYIDNLQNRFEDYHDKAAAVFLPRVGVELFHHVRVTLGAQISRRGFHTLDLSVGFVLGGRPKKQK